MVFKHVEAVFQLFQFIWVGLIAVPLDQFPVAKFLPLSWGTHLIREVMIGEKSLFELPGSDLLFRLANSAFYCILGFAAFKWLEGRAKDLGLLGHY